MPTPPTTLTTEQQQRTEALLMARKALQDSSISGNRLRKSTSENALMFIAEWILDGLVNDEESDGPVVVVVPDGQVEAIAALNAKTAADLPHGLLFIPQSAKESARTTFTAPVPTDIRLRAVDATIVETED